MKGAGRLPSLVMKEHNSFAPQRRGGRREELKFSPRAHSALIPALRCQPSPISSLGARLMKGAGRLLSLLSLAITPLLPAAEDLGSMWGSAKEEAKYYPIVNIPIPPEIPMRPGSFEIVPGGRLAVGTRRGDIYFIKGAFETPPRPQYQLFASGQDEIFGLAWKDGAMTATTFGEVTRICDSDGDGVADRYDTLTNNWGYAEGHEFAFEIGRAHV